MVSNYDASLDAPLSKNRGLRQQLLRTAVDKGLTDDEVVRLSQELDI
ncbi:aspartyl-phosphate phosphatase Spo0E family protein [Paenibacillus apiarius]|nr:aspartyl-phosphate phosphatase Spo0E family protein [Paenibacillus apiarius]